MRLHHLVTVFSLTSTALALPSPQNGAPAGRRQPSTQGAREVQWYEPLLAFGGIGAVATLGWAADKFYFKPGRNGQTPSSPTPNTGNGGNVIAQVGEAVDGPDRHALEGIRDQDITADMLTKGKVDWTKVDWELWGACLREKVSFTFSDQFIPRLCRWLGTIHLRSIPRCSSVPPRAVSTIFSIVSLEIHRASWGPFTLAPIMWQSL